MKFKENIICAIIVIVTAFLLLVTTILLMTSVPRFIFEKRLSGIPSEVSDVPAVSVYGTLHIENKKYDIATLCRRKDCHFQEILCVLDEKAYIICSQSNDWVAMSYDLKSGELCKLFTYQNPGTHYKIKPSEKMKNKNGFYFNDHIVLTDGVTVMSYCISSKSIETTIYSDYIFPENTITGKTVSKESIEISINGKTKQFSFTQIAEDSNSIGEIYALKGEKYWDGPSRIPYFFNDSSVQVVDNRVYAIGSCMHYFGESYAIILQYDPSEDSWRYVAYYFFGDIVDEDCYIVFTE